MFLIGGTGSLSIAETIIHRFPDGELYVRIKEKIEKHEIIIIQTTYPDENIIELFLLLDACKRANAKKITVIIPYFGYARQDKQFKPGEPISAEALATLICVNADEIITIDPHKEHIKGFFSIPTKSVSAVPALAEYLKNKKIDVVLAPDEGALKRAKDTAKILNCEVDYLEKKRIDGNTITIKPKQLEVKNKNVAIIDDIISTGGTMAAAITELKKQKAAKVHVVCTHGLFAGTAIEKLKKAQCDEIISTETIKSAYSIVKITPVLTSLF